MPWLIRMRDGKHCVYKRGADGEPAGDALGCHDSEAGAERQRRALEANVNEMISGQFTDVMAITELRGSYPNVPIAPDVDYAALIAGDDDPMFLTLPIAEIDSVSINGRYYDAEWVAELERQTLANKPVGLMGHLSESERATAFPDEAIHWVGVARHGKQSWGKGYVPPGPVRDRIRRYKAQGKAMATSIDAFAEGKWQEARKAYHMDPKTLKLGQIDIAPADRAGIPSLAAVPHVTREMEDDNDVPDKGDITVDKYQVIREMTPEDAKLLPDTVRDAILATVPDPETPPEVALVTELREALGVDEKADLPALITELRQAEAQRKQDAIKQRITELVTAEDGGIKAKAMRGMVTELVTARNPQTPEEAEAAYKQVCELEAVKTALQGHVREAMGPPQRTPLQGQNGKQNKYFVIPEKDKEG